MSTRTPTSFTKYISTALCSAREPIVPTSLDAIINDQQFANQRGRLISMQPPGLDFFPSSDPIYIPTVIGRNNGSGTVKVRFYAYVSTAGTWTWEIGIRPDHVSSWTTYQTAMSAVSGWRDFGVDITTSIVSMGSTGIYGIGDVMMAASLGTPLFYGWAVFAQPG